MNGNIIFFIFKLLILKFTKLNKSSIISNCAEMELNRLQLHFVNYL